MEWNHLVFQQNGGSGPWTAIRDGKASVTVSQEWRQQRHRRGSEANCRSQSSTRAAQAEAW